MLAVSIEMPRLRQSRHPSSVDGVDLYVLSVAVIFGKLEVTF